jgi:hypothetical protein
MILFLDLSFQKGNWRDQWPSHGPLGRCDTVGPAAQPSASPIAGAVGFK